MADGLRFVNPDLAGADLILHHPRKPYAMRLDGEGAITVSPAIAQRIEEATSAGITHGLTFSNTVKAPPKQTLGIDFHVPEGAVAIRHRWLRNEVVPVFSERKIYHIAVDSSGAAVVAEAVWQRLEQAGRLIPHGFEFLKAGEKGVKTPSRRRTVEARMNEAVKATVPGAGRIRYETVPLTPQKV